MKLSLFAGVFKDRTIDELIAAARRYGYDAVEIRTNHSANLPADVTREEMERVKALLDEAGIAFPHYYGLGGGYAVLSDEDCEKQFTALRHYADIAEFFGCEFLSQGPGGNSPDLPDEVFARAAHWLAKGADLLADRGMKLISEIHNNGLIENAEGSVKLAEMVNRDNFGYIYDPANMMICEREWKGPALAMLGEKVFWVHVKDMAAATADDPRTITVRGRLWQYNLLGDGDVHFEQVFADLKRIGYEGHLSFECNVLADGDLVAEHEAKVARRMLAGEF